MANTIELDPVSRITAGAIGRPGERVFLIQAERGRERITLVCEKEHVQALTDAIEEMALNLEKEFGLARQRDLRVDEKTMAIADPAEPLFRVGAIGLGYDANRDRILLVAQEALAEGEERDPLEVRFFATRAQMEALCQYGRDVISRGRSPDKVALEAGAYVRRNGHED